MTEVRVETPLDVNIICGGFVVTALLRFSCLLSGPFLIQINYWHRNLHEILAPLRTKTALIALRDVHGRATKQGWEQLSQRILFRGSKGDFG